MLLCIGQCVTYNHDKHVYLGDSNVRWNGCLSERSGIKYYERSHLNVENSAIVSETHEVKESIPIESIAAIALGPGTSLTHRAVRLCMDAGCSIAWVSSGMRSLDAIASAPVLDSIKLSEAQAEITSSPSERRRAARKMLEVRFDEAPSDRLSENQLRGWEGVRMRRMYRELASKYDVEWNGRVTSGRFSDLDAPNALISGCNGILYTAVHVAVGALRLSPETGILHRSQRRAFVMDLADLYRVDVVIEPIFRLLGENNGDVMSADARAIVLKEVEDQVFFNVFDDIRDILS